MQYSCCNLAHDKPVSIALLEKLEDIEQVVISVRPPLVTALSTAEMDAYCVQLVQGLNVFLQALLAHNKKIQSILHISSVAAVNHLQAQHLVGTNDEPFPSSDALEAPYDRFKRACEEVVEQLAATVSTVSLRLSAIFSDDPGCIQCQALGIQSRVGSYLPRCIDCNSSRNVAAAVRLILASQQEKAQLASYYYYTRPVRQYPQPLSYGEYLSEYRRALDLWWYVWIPVWIVCFFVETVHWLARRIKSRLAFLDSIDYLLQVSYRDHCFDNSAFVADFPEIVDQEETIEECFRRRQKVLC